MGPAVGALLHTVVYRAVPPYHLEMVKRRRSMDRGRMDEEEVVVVRESGGNNTKDE